MTHLAGLPQPGFPLMLCLHIDNSRIQCWATTSKLEGVHDMVLFICVGNPLMPLPSSVQVMTWHPHPSTRGGGAISCWLGCCIHCCYHCVVGRMVVIIVVVTQWCSITQKTRVSSLCMIVVFSVRDIPGSLTHFVNLTRMKVSTVNDEH